MFYTVITIVNVFIFLGVIYVRYFGIILIRRKAKEDLYELEKCNHQQQFYVSSGNGKAGALQAANREDIGYKDKQNCLFRA